MIRRSHKKSRGGCAQCKRVHKKVSSHALAFDLGFRYLYLLQCDETRPKCVNCTVSKRHCSYNPTTNPLQPNDLEFVVSLGPDNRSPFTSSSSQQASNEGSPWQLTPLATPPLPEPYVNLLHLELFQNMTTNFFEFIAEDATKDECLSTVLRVSALVYPLPPWELGLPVNNHQISITLITHLQIC